MPTVSKFQRRFALGLSLWAVLMVVGAATLDYKWAKSTVERHAREELDKEWGAMKGYLRLEFDPNSRTIQGAWYYDTSDSDQAAMASRLKSRCLIVDQAGKVLHQPPMFQEISDELLQMKRSGALDSTSNSILQIKNDGVGYLVRAGLVLDEGHKSRYFVALAKPVPAEQSSLLPFEVYTSVLLVGAGLLGWSIGRRSPNSNA